VPPHDDQHLDGADIRGFYTALGIHLPYWATVEASVRCFADPDAHRRGDRKPSCSVNLASGAWNCHGCDASGGAYDAAIRLGHDRRSAIDLMVRFGLVERRRGSPQCRRRSRRPSRPQPSKPGSAPALEVSEDEVAHWRLSLGLQPLLLQRLARERSWSVSTYGRLSSASTATGSRSPCGTSNADSSACFATDHGAPVAGVRRCSQRPAHADSCCHIPARSRHGNSCWSRANPTCSPLDRTDYRRSHSPGSNPEARLGIAIRRPVHRHHHGRRSTRPRGGGSNRARPRFDRRRPDSGDRTKSSRRLRPHRLARRGAQS
jgi:hypothetical protein